MTAHPAPIRGTLPWAQRRGSTWQRAGRPDPVPDPPAPPVESQKGKQKWHGPMAEAISRYPNPADRAAILGARLAELRANPPTGYPR